MFLFYIHLLVLYCFFVFLCWRLSFLDGRKRLWLTNQPACLSACGVLSPDEGQIPHFPGRYRTAARSLRSSLAIYCGAAGSRAAIDEPTAVVCGPVRPAANPCSLFTSAPPPLPLPSPPSPARLAGPVVKASASRARVRIPLALRFFRGRVTPVTSKLALQWLPCQAPGVLGSVLGLVGPVSVDCDWVRWEV